MTAFLTSKHKNFPIVRHFLKDLIESSHGFSARVSFIIRENHQSGKLLRRSGGKSPASWQEKSVSVAKLIRFMHSGNFMRIKHGKIRIKNAPNELSNNADG